MFGNYLHHTSVYIFASVTVVSPLRSAEMSEEEASKDLPVSMQLHRANFGLSQTDTQDLSINAVWG